MTPRCLHKELSAIKKKWHDIGKGLKVPSKHLDMFTGLADPLLEVIVYWLKGGGDMPPSWDAIVVMLRDINETELADKIHMLYRHQEDEEDSEGNDEAYSGTYILDGHKCSP